MHVIWTRVTLADGTQEKIGKSSISGWTSRFSRMTPRRAAWFRAGRQLVQQRRADEFLQFTVAKSGGNGRAQFAATENHLVRTPGGWRQAGS